MNAFHEKGNLAAAFRLIPNNIKSIDDLRYSGGRGDVWSDRMGWCS